MSMQSSLSETTRQWMMAKGYSTQNLNGRGENANHCLTLIYELIDDRLESYISPNNSINGFIFLVSCVYYRSSWKYQDRGVRYRF
ncbi:hypothetical protein WA1_34620 [Scytonema hofmannii PCC 7110]|uniref:Uncharacterized protein n=1 Tax=Scytonema hofmannii PCC 7110 TaxID=128403 RepID=A0A139X340_9CYAN|nr:hypothetical protein WA1_34620 [Scytonema hofmannii PCC 7110]